MALHPSIPGLCDFAGSLTRSVTRSSAGRFQINRRPFPGRLCLGAVLVLGLGTGGCQTPVSPARAERDLHWIAAWTTASLPVDAAKDDTPLAGATLRQVVRITGGGPALRLRIGNHFGTEPLVLQGVRVALAGPGGAIEPGSSRVVRFNGADTVSVPAGARLLSDPVELPLAAGADVAISLWFEKLPDRLTSHPGSRATSYLQAGDALDAVELPAAKAFARWYFIDGIEVLSRAAGAIAILGDSITDGYGCKPDSNTRWPDFLARRLQADGAPDSWAVLNLGIGGNRLLRDGLGPNALARLERDVIAQPGVRWLVVFAGINDLGTRLTARKQQQPFASAAEIIMALDQLAARAQAHGIRVVGGTITPYAGSKSYWSEDGEADRQAVNRWIRESGRFAAVIDFDVALRDASDPARLDPNYDSGDHLHPSAAGYQALANAVPLGIFKP